MCFKAVPNILVSSSPLSNILRLGVVNAMHPCHFMDHCEPSTSFIESVRENESPLNLLLLLEKSTLLIERLSSLSLLSLAPCFKRRSASLCEWTELVSFIIWDWQFMTWKPIESHAIIWETASPSTPTQEHQIRVHVYYVVHDGTPARLFWTITLQIWVLRMVIRPSWRWRRGLVASRGEFKDLCSPGLMWTHFTVPPINPFPDWE